MSAAIPLPFVQNTPAWVDARRDVVGSSDIPIVTGNSPFRTSLFTLAAIKNRMAEPEPIDPETQELYDLGHAMEPIIADRWSAKTGRPHRRLRRMLVSREVPWAGASLDYMTGQDILEIKLVVHRRWDMEGEEQVPAHVQDQCQWQMFVKGADVCHVGVMLGWRTEPLVVERSDKYIDDLRYIAWHKFWDPYVVHRSLPPVDGSESTTATIGRMFPRHERPLLAPTPEIDAVALRIRETTRAHKAAEQAKDQARNAMRLLIENAEGAAFVDKKAESAAIENGWLGYRAYWRRSEDKPALEVTETDWESVSKAYRALLDAQVDGAAWDRISDEERRIAQHLDPAALDAIQALHTSTRIEEAKEGTRTLRVYFRDEETGKWQ